MREAGFDTVRLAEFAWARLEPRPGVLDFAWLNEAIEVLGRERISVVLGTPTCSPPKWLVDADPSMLLVDRGGQPRRFGSRNSICSNHPGWRGHTKRIVREMAMHYADDRRVVAFQIDNELGGHGSTCCYCENCRAAFTAWLRERHGSLDSLNAAWGTVFWSHTLSSWDEIYLPMTTTADQEPGGFVHNPGLLLDFQRFSSASKVGYAALQRATIAEAGARQPVTTNLMGHYGDLDYHQLSTVTDFASWDNYPVGRDLVDASMAHDLTRGLLDRRFWVMEQWSGPCGWNFAYATPRPGEIAFWALHAYAHGAEAVLFFRWRACRFATEQYWHGILDHDGVPRRRYHEVKSLGAALRKLGPWLDGSRVHAEVALVKDYEALWSHRFQPGAPGFRYEDLLHRYYSAVVACGAGCRVSSLAAALEANRVVLIPAYCLMDDRELASLQRFVADGGSLVATFRSGIREKDNRIADRVQPGYLAALAGVELLEFEALPPEAGVVLQHGHGTARTWCDFLRPVDAEVVASYDDPGYPAAAAITRRRHGRGTVWYVGCALEPGPLAALMARILTEAGIEPGIPGNGKIDLVERRMEDGRRIHIVANPGPGAQQVDLPGPMEDPLGGEVVGGRIEIPALSIRVLVEAGTRAGQ
jgi:beta-galactosidase